MSSVNGRAGGKAVLYARVSTDEQARNGYSILDQLGTLRDYVAREGYHVVEECVDDGWSGADPDRPGIRRVMELAEVGAVEIVVAVNRDRFFRSRLYRLLMDRDFQECGTRLKALNDTGNRIGDGVQDDFAEWEREQITERTMRGKLEKARQGKIIAGRLTDYGFRFTSDRNGYEVNEAAMTVVRRIFSELASGVSVNGVCASLDADGVPPPGAAKKWQRTFVRDCAFDDAYVPHTLEELETLGVSSEVLEHLDPGGLYGVWWYNRRETRTVRVPLGGGHYRKGRQIRKKPKREWIPVPVPASGVPREDLVRACARRGLRVEGLLSEGWNPQEVFLLRLQGSPSEGERCVLLLENPERLQDRGRGVGGCEGRVARPGSSAAGPRRLPRGREDEGRGRSRGGGPGVHEQDRGGRP